MKKALIITSLVALLGASAVMADQGFGGGRGMDRMKTALGLNDTQAAQVDSIMQDQQARMQALRDETNQRIQALLTPEQAAKFQEMQQRRREHQGNKRGGSFQGNYQQQPPATSNGSGF
jgi:Spy/CpxP family protein refolding chaperone